MLPTFDRVAFHSVSGLDLYGADVVCQVIELFIKHTASIPDDLDAAVEAHDGSTAQRILHRLKGSAAGMGGASLAELCRSLQAQDESTSVPNLNDSQRIREAYSELVAALHDEYAYLSGTAIKQAQSLASGVDPSPPHPSVLAPQRKPQQHAHGSSACQERRGDEREGTRRAVSQHGEKATVRERRRDERRKVALPVVEERRHAERRQGEWRRQSLSS